MKKSVTDNLGLKILAVLFSMVLWLIVVNINDPIQAITFRNIPVEIQNADAITSEGKVYEVLDGTDLIDVTVRAQRSIIDSIGRDNIIATADMEELNFKDTIVRIKLSTNKYNDKLDSIKSNTENLKVSIEDMKKTQFVVEAETTGNPAKGYILGDVSMNQNLVKLSGPDSLISQVKRVGVTVDVTGVTEDIRTDADIKLYDSDDNVIENSNIKKSIDQVGVNVGILQLKSVPLSYSTTGTPETGYALTGTIDSNPANVKIAGKASALKSISKIEIPASALNVTGQSSDMMAIINVKDYLPDNVFLVDATNAGKVSVTVRIQKLLTRDLTIDADKISIANMPSGFKGTIKATSDTLAFSVKGLVTDMAVLDSMQIAAAVDINALMTSKNLTEMSAGTYDAALTFNLPSGVELVEPLTVKVIVTASEDTKTDTENKTTETTTGAASGTTGAAGGTSPAGTTNSATTPAAASSATGTADSTAKNASQVSGTALKSDAN